MIAVGKFLIPQPYCYAMRVERVWWHHWWASPEFSRIAYTVFALTEERLPDLGVQRSRVGECFADVRPAIGDTWFRRHDGQLWQASEALPLYLERVQLPGQLSLF